MTWRDRVRPTLAGYQSGALGLLGVCAEVYPTSGKGLPVGPGIDVRYPLGPVALALSGGFRAVVVPDAIGRAFPRSRSGGVDAEASATLDLGRTLQLRLAGRHARFYYTLHPMPGDRFIAGGALDEFAVLDLTCAARW